MMLRFPKAVFAGVMSVVVAHCNDSCLPKPPDADLLEHAYNAELLKCVADARTLSESCYCRKAVDVKWGVCDHPEWPKMGRCDTDCGAN